MRRIEFCMCNFKSLLRYLLLASFVIIGASCSDDSNGDVGKKEIPFDPTKDVVITSFTPESGSLRTKMFIYGSNFGTDVSKITVTIGDKQASVIGSDGNCIYCIVPPRADKQVQVEVTDGKVVKTSVAEKEFTYVFNPVVSTLIRNVDQYGHASMMDGPFSEAGVVNPYWLTIDPKDPTKLFYIEWGTNVRQLNLKDQVLTTLIAKGAGGMSRPSSACWTAGGDTLLVSNGQSTYGDNSIAVLYLTRSSQFRSIRTLATTEGCNSVAVNPKDGEIFYMSARNARVLRYNKETQLGDVIATFSVLGNQFRMFFHPSGKYLYLFDEYHGYIAKSFYDFETKSFNPPIIFAGKFGANYEHQGYQDGVGEDARFSWGYQGIFVENDDYVREGREDVYDFYITDSNNHCIRILTPDARMTTFAGRGSSSLDNKVTGYVDGDLRQEARFNWPDGIYYDSENRIFYIADYYNHAIRVINMAE